MLEHIADFTAWPILTGILVGYIANRIMSGEGKGCCMNLIIGIIGSYAGTFIQLCWYFHQPSAEHRIAWQRLSHQLRVLRHWCCNSIVDLEEAV